MYWKRLDLRVRKEPQSTRDKELAAVRLYLENNSSCRRRWLLQYFDSAFESSVDDPKSCCDVCACVRADEQL